ncbi:MAG: hypothetical protein JRN15_24040 [Nitrososphaerota archaeon]|nr:hypothetical protein [Nitrososphaerota archaeon]
MTDTEFCPNARCADKTKVEVGSFCKSCGTQVRKLGLRERMGVVGAKSKLAKAQEKIQKGDASILFSEEMSDEDIEEEINKDMMNLLMHEAGTGWMRAGTLLSGNSTDQMLGAGFKAIIDQNKIIIRQNELIRRELKILNEGNGAAASPSGLGK